MIGLMNVYIAWPVLVLIIVAGLGFGVLLGMLFKTHRINTSRFDSYSNKSKITTGSVGGITGSGFVTSDYEYFNEKSHQDLEQKAVCLEAENTQLKRKVTDLTDKLDRNTLKLKTIENKLEKISKELEEEENPIYNQIISLLRTLNQRKLGALTNRQTSSIIVSEDDQAIQFAIDSGAISYQERWFDSNGQEIADNRLDLLNYLNNNNIQQLGNVRTK